VAVKAAARSANWGRLMGIVRGTFALNSGFADVIAHISSHAIKSDAHLAR
jgi:hypothetical protein